MKKYLSIGLLALSLCSMFGAIFPPFGGGTTTSSSSSSTNLTGAALGQVGAIVTQNTATNFASLNMVDFGTVSNSAAVTGNRGEFDMPGGQHFTVVGAGGGAARFAFRSGMAWLTNGTTYMQITSAFPNTVEGFVDYSVTNVAYGGDVTASLYILLSANNMISGTGLALNGLMHIQVQHSSVLVQASATDVSGLINLGTAYFNGDGGFTNQLTRQTVRARRVGTNSIMIEGSHITPTYFTNALIGQALPTGTNPLYMIVEQVTPTSALSAVKVYSFGTANAAASAVISAATAGLTSMSGFNETREWYLQDQTYADLPFYNSSEEFRIGMRSGIVTFRYVGGAELAKWNVYTHELYPATIGYSLGTLALPWQVNMTNSVSLGTFQVGQSNALGSSALTISGGNPALSELAFGLRETNGNGFIQAGRSVFVDLDDNADGTESFNIRANGGGVSNIFTVTEGGLIGVDTSSPLYPLHVTNTVNTLALFAGNIADYAQLNVQNYNNSVGASSDLVATAGNGTDTNWFVDVGINGPAGGQQPFTNGNHAYVYSQASNNQPHALNIGALGSNSSVRFYAGAPQVSGGVTNPVERMRIETNGTVSVANGNFTIDSAGNETMAAGTTLMFGTAGSAGTINFGNRAILSYAGTTADFGSTSSGKDTRILNENVDSIHIANTTHNVGINTASPTAQVHNTNSIAQVALKVDTSRTNSIADFTSSNNVSQFRVETNGPASFSTQPTNAIAAVGYTNNTAVNMQAFVTATAVSFTLKDRNQNSLYVSPTLTATLNVGLQPGWSITAASGLTGTVVPGL